MGCLCGKEASPERETQIFDEKAPRIASMRQRSVRSGSARIDNINGIVKEDLRPKDKSRANGLTHSANFSEEQNEKKQRVPSGSPRNIPKHVTAEQVAAGWPAWLSAVAGEAIKGWIPRRADSFEKLAKIGQGTYSNVYKARDLESGKVVALKKVRFDNMEPESVKFMAREIQVLRRLDHPNVVKLEGLVTSRMSCSLYLVFEYMEHDLAGLAACPGVMFTQPQVKCYLQQLLRGLDHCHSRGILHRDIKGSNLLLDNGGILKIADFGLATMFNPDQKQVLTSRVVTLWYRPPELLLGATDYGVAVDLWSTGCILAELLAGKPIMPGRTEVEQLHKIFKLCGSPSEEYWKKSKLPHATIFKPQQPYKRCISETFKDFPPTALSLLETLLAIEPADRGTAAAALKTEFFTTKPYACDPSSLPQYPPSKEFDAKTRDEESRRQRAAGGRHGASDARRGSRERSKAVPAPDANAELPVSLQKRRIHAHSAKSKSEKFPPLTEDTAIGFPLEPHRTSEVSGTSPAPASHQFVQAPLSSRSGPVTNPGGIGQAWGRKSKEDDVRMAPPRMMPRTSKPVTVTDFTSQPGANDSSNFSNSVGVRHGTSGDHRRERRDGKHREREGIDGGEYKKTEVNGSRTDKQDLTERHLDKYHQDADVQKEIELSCKRDPPANGNAGFESQSERIYQSGPLLQAGYSAADIEDFLEGHERRLQQAARRAVQADQKTRNQLLSMPDKKGAKGSFLHNKQNGGGEILEVLSSGNGKAH